MTPRDIITKHIHKIEGIRLPAARITIDQIFKELEEEGYVIIEASELRKGTACPQNSSTKATLSRS